jgi:DNA primase
MISPETIALVKERTDLVALIGETVRLQRRGRSFVGLCPFHKEKSPSFHVNPERGIYHCFGCKESGTAIDFLMKVEGMNFAETVRALGERGGIEVVETSTDAEKREANAARRARDDLYAVNNLAATFFEQCMRGPSAHPLARYALAEIGRRGLDAQDATGPVADALQAFRVGYAPPGWDGLALFLKRQGISPMVAERVGLLVPRASGSGHYDRFRHRLMFAVTDVMGRVVAFSGRSLPEPSADELRELGLQPSSGDAPAKYMNSPESPIFTKGEHLFGLHQARHAIRQAGEAVVVEGNFDVVSLHARGMGNVVAPLGTAFTPAQAKLLKRFAPTVTVLFDGDTAGRKATRAARGPCKESGLTAKVAVLPAGLDPDELMRQKGPEALEQLVKNARAMREYLIDDALDGDAFGGSTLDEQRARLKAVAQILTEEDDPTLRAMTKLYADRLSSKLVVGGRSPTDVRELERMLEQATSRGPVARQEPAEGTSVEPGSRARSRARVEEMGRLIVGALMDFPELLDDASVLDALDVLDGDFALVVDAVRQSRWTETGLYTDEFLARIPASIHSFAAGRLASPGFEAAVEAKDELLKNAEKLRRLSLSRENAATVDELHRVAPQGDVALEDALLLESVRRAKAKRGLA